MSTTATHSSVLDVARGLRPVLLACRDDAERLGHLHPKVVAAAGSAGMFRLLAPRTVGGHQLPLPQQHAVWEELARNDPTVAWCSWNAGPAGYVAGFLRPETAARVYGDSDACFSWSGISAAIATPVPDGVQLTGRWPVVSGAQVSSWFALSCRIPPANGAESHTHAVALVPADDVEIHDTWRAGAFRATGSHAVSATNVFVPEDLVWRPDMRPNVDDPLYRLGTGLLFGPALGPIALGIASAAYDAMLDLTQRVSAASRGAIRERTLVQETAADTSAALRAARLGHYSAADALWDAVEHGEDTSSGRAQLWSASFHAVETAVSAVDRLHRAVGIDALVAGSVLDRALREVHGIAPYSDAFRGLRSAAGRVSLGLDPNHPLF